MDESATEITTVREGRPTIDRVVTCVEPPIQHKLSVSMLLDSETGLIDMGILRHHLFGEGILRNDAVSCIFKKTKQILEKEPNLLRINSKSPIVICGDIHGQYYDLLTIFKLGGDICMDDTNYLFLGDYVDRGAFGIECILHLMALKINYPTKIYLLRGNHETCRMTAFYTFRRECCVKYNIDIYNECMELFDALPIAAVVDNRLFCVHGGLSPDIIDIGEINDMDRLLEPTEENPIYDFLWADPDPYFDDDAYGRFRVNTQRKASVYYNLAACRAFLRHNGLASIIRAHQVELKGYHLHQGMTDSNFPPLITVFSAPNYADCNINQGAIIFYKNSDIVVKCFKAEPHPYVLGDRLFDGFSWSLVFFAEMGANVVSKLLNICSQDELDSGNLSRAEVIKAKIESVSKMRKYYATLRDEQDCVIFLKGLTETGKLPHGILFGGRSTLLEALQGLITTDPEEYFNKVKELDAKNEVAPSASRGFLAFAERGDEPVGTKSNTTGGHGAVKSYKVERVVKITSSLRLDELNINRNRPNTNLETSAENDDPRHSRLPEESTVVFRTPQTTPRINKPSVNDEAYNGKPKPDDEEEK